MIQKSADILDIAILETLVAPREGSMSPALAKEILSIKFQDKQQTEIQKLLDRNNEGTITARQKAKLEAYVRVGNWLSLMKAKARASLAAKTGRR